LPARHALLAAAALAALVLSACSSKLDTDKAEKEIRKGISDQTGVEISRVRCPDDVEAEKGSTFNCVAVAESGQRATVRVRQQDDEGSVTWRVVREK
jgi:hypothetical protein